MTTEPRKTLVVVQGTTEKDTTEKSQRDVLRVRRAEDLVSTPQEWLAVGWLVQRAITVLVGEEGIGKSLWWVRVVAHLTTGRPDTSINLPAGEPRTVVLITSEDEWAEVKARLCAAGADLDRIKMLCRADDGSGYPILPGNDAAHAKTEIGAAEPDLVVVDAWLDTVDGAVRIPDPHQARTALRPWAEIAESTGAAVLLITHTNRLATTNTRDRMGATGVLRQKARVVLFAATQPDLVGHAVYVGPDKANTTGRSDAVRYTVRITQARERTEADPGTTAYLSDPEPAGMRVHELLRRWDEAERAAQAPAEVKPPTALDRAKTAVLAYLHALRDDTDDDGRARVERSPDGRSVIVATADLHEWVTQQGESARRTNQAVTELGGHSSNQGARGGPWRTWLPVALLGEDTEADTDSDQNEPLPGLELDAPAAQVSQVLAVSQVSRDIGTPCETNFRQVSQPPAISLKTSETGETSETRQSAAAPSEAVPATPPATVRKRRR